MAPVIEWRRTPDRQHIGSVELRGLAANPPFLYVHPLDEADAPRASRAAGWQYNHADTGDASLTANGFVITVRGGVSFTEYQRQRLAYQAVPPDQRTEPWNGQENAREALGAALATGLQASGSATYDAFLSLVPASDAPVAVTLDADMLARAVGRASLFARIGMGRATDSKAQIFDQNGFVHGVLALARLRFPIAWKRARHRRQYVVIVPPGDEVMIGRVSTGMAYAISRGSSSFSSLARIDFTVIGRE